MTSATKWINHVQPRRSCRPRRRLFLLSCFFLSVVSPPSRYAGPVNFINISKMASFTVAAFRPIHRAHAIQTHHHSSSTSMTKPPFVGCRVNMGDSFIIPRFPIDTLQCMQMRQSHQGALFSASAEPVGLNVPPVKYVPVGLSSVATGGQMATGEGGAFTVTSQPPLQAQTEPSKRPYRNFLGQ